MPCSIGRCWDREDGSAFSVIERLVGLQAQQPQPPFVGLWTRLVQFEGEDLLGLLSRREVVRSTAMRGTLHLMTAVDFLAFRQTLQPMLTAGMTAVLRDRAKDLDIPALRDVARTFFSGEPKTFADLREGFWRGFRRGTSGRWAMRCARTCRWPPCPMVRPGGSGPIRVSRSQRGG